MTSAEGSAGAGPRPGGGEQGDLYRPFRPRAARVVAVVLGVAVLVMMVAIALLLPSAAPDRQSWLDRAGIAGFGVLVAWFLWRQASVRAVPDTEGVTVRNLLITRRVAWPEIISVRFGHGRPWVQLDLADGDVLAVMGVQAADGDRSVAEARRMATLVALHSATPRDD